ncbi:MAG: 30S ribosomal protein S20 [Bdellovibrionaceae bacterium]|nr:30S ribosomal protein S20 [Pseudobdellovibrionaceae bacterium]
MANHKSAAKRARQSPKRAARNANAKSTVKTFEKKLMKAIEAKSADAKELLKAYTAKAMSAVSKGVLKKETVSRKIGRLSTRVSAK